MSELAVRYKRKTSRHEVQVSVPRGAVTHLHLPDDDAKAHLVTAMLKARCEPGEELELFGEPALALAAGRREKVRARVGAVSPIVTTCTSWPRSRRKQAKSGPWVAGPPTSGGQIPVRKTMRMGGQSHRVS